MLVTLADHHGIFIGKRQLHRILRNNNLYRRKGREPVNQTLIAIYNEMEKGPGRCFGYRFMHQKLRMNGHCVDRETVRIIVKTLDPDSVALRKAHRLQRRQYYSRGPNYLWHLDGYDKLKYYGFPIHGAIDGYSRKILWLRICKTNNDPKFVASYFVRCIKENNFVPRCVRTDRGSENIVIAGIQRYLRRNGNDQMAGRMSFMFGTSTGNQRIESWWSIFKRNRAFWWINFFKDLVDSSIYDPDISYHVECARFCFLPLLQLELDETVALWNSHRIRKVRNSESPAGRPDILYFSPQHSNGRESGYRFNNRDMSFAEQMTADPSLLPCSPAMNQLCRQLMATYNYELPKDARSAKALFLLLVQLIDNL